MSDEKVTPEEYLARIRAELECLDGDDRVDRDMIANMRADIAARKARRAELRRMLPRAPRTKKGGE